jgi:type II secretory pathway component PulC
MNPKIRQNVIFVLFILALIYGAVNLKGSKSNSDVNAIGPSQKSDSTLSAAAERHIDTAEYKKMDWGTDPFYRTGPQTVSSIPVTVSRQWKLDGILYDPVAPAAIINNQIVKVGETIDGARVRTINKNNVILDNNGNSISINLEKEKI